MRSPRREGSLLTRVTLVAALSAAGGGLAAAVAATIAANRAIEVAVDRRLEDQAAALLTQLEAAPDVSREISDESIELASLGLRIAVYDNGKHLGGDRLNPPTAMGCSTIAEAGHRARRCAVARGPRVAVISMDRLAETRWSAYATATLVAVLTATLLGVLASRATARWAVSPLTRLRDRIVRGEADLGPDEGIREVDTLRAALRESLRRSSEAAATAERFAAGAAHELRTPLSVISAELELLADAVGEPTTREGLARVRSSVTALSRLTERLLVLARAGDGEGMEMADAVMLGELLEAQRAPGVTVRGDAMVRGDETLLTMMIENAIQNALHHGNAPVEVTLTERGADVVIDIVDHGPGIRADERERIFEPFVRARGTEREGFGLGLSLIARVARVHRGSAEFLASQTGAHLRIVLPLWQPR